MKKFLTTSTSVLKAGLAAKEFVGTILSPITALRNFVKKAIIKSMVFLIKKSINLTMNGKVSADSNIVVHQLNALTDPAADTSKITKNVQFKVTLDTLLEQVDEVEEYKVLKYIDLTSAKNKLAGYKNSLRKDIYEYMSEDSFKNINSLVDSVNKVLAIPTEIVGCEFVNCKVKVESHDETKPDFVLLFDVDFCVKSST
jgi:hypothetical protein